MIDQSPVAMGAPGVLVPFGREAGDAAKLNMARRPREPRMKAARARGLKDAIVAELCVRVIIVNYSFSLRQRRA
jgi:hypothetical protein